MREQFTADLEKLHVNFHKMGGLVLEQLKNVMKAYNEDDVALAEEIIKRDAKINETESILEHDSIQLIALQAPVTSDLRKIITVLKASSDLERMGDHIKSMAKIVRTLNKNEELNDIERQIIAMGRRVEEMLDAVLEAYVNQDVQKAKEVAALDQAVDEMRDQIRESAFEEMHNNTNLIDSASSYVQMARFLERVGDYCKNVSEWVLYLEEGEIVDLD